MAPPSYDMKFCNGNFNCYWVYLGSAGRALAFWRLYYNSYPYYPKKAMDYLDLAKEYIDGSLSRLNHDNDNYISFLNGNVGVYAIASVIYDSLGDY
jgi:hypothetical protein